jgi:hypothetical protein
MLSENLDNFQTNEIIEIISNKRVDLSTTNEENIVLDRDRRPVSKSNQFQKPV